MARPSTPSTEGWRARLEQVHRAFRRADEGSDSGYHPTATPPDRLGPEEVVDARWCTHQIELAAQHAKAASFEVAQQQIKTLAAIEVCLARKEAALRALTRKNPEPAAIDEIEREIAELTSERDASLSNLVSARRRQRVTECAVRSPTPRAPSTRPSTAPHHRAPPPPSTSSPRQLRQQALRSQRRRHLSEEQREREALNSEQRRWWEAQRRALRALRDGTAPRVDNRLSSGVEGERVSLRMLSDQGRHARSAEWARQGESLRRLVHTTEPCIESYAGY